MDAEKSRCPLPLYKIVGVCITLQEFDRGYRTFGMIIEDLTGTRHHI
jgi:hypothetical protein